MVRALLSLAFIAASPATAQQPAPQPQPQLRIAAASDLEPVLPTIIGAMEFATKAHISVSYASSATLAQQIENGAPFDLFLAADYTYPEQLVAAGLTVQREPVPYARGALVLWARKNSPLQPLTSNTLYDKRLQKLAIANPDHAPYGRAAESALIKLKLYDQLKPTLVIGENVGQTAQFADSGNAQAALISLTIASSAHYRETGTFIRIDPEAYPTIRQCAVILKASPNNPQAKQFLDLLTNDRIQKLLPTYGLAPAQ